MSRKNRKPESVSDWPPELAHAFKQQVDRFFTLLEADGFKPTSPQSARVIQFSAIQGHGIELPTTRDRTPDDTG
jgi:hypothetical protein